MLHGVMIVPFSRIYVSFVIKSKSGIGRFLTVLGEGRTDVGYKDHVESGSMRDPKADVLYLDEIECPKGCSCDQCRLKYDR